MPARTPVISAVFVLFAATGCSDALPRVPDSLTGVPLESRVGDHELDRALAASLAEWGFTGRIASTLERRLGRRIDPQLADVGRLVFFDPITGLNGDNSCSGCHGPQASFGDSKSIAVGIGNNGIVGPDRKGPRNQRRSPTIVNAAFYPRLMWNSRFEALSDDPFDNSVGFHFPAPEGLSLSHMSHLLGAQGFIPFTERVEMAGFDFPGGNDDIRDEVLRRLNAIRGYRERFGRAFPDVRAGGPIRFDQVGAAISEFSLTLVFADAPIDRFARGVRGAMTTQQKEGALLFFGPAGCVQCHAVSGLSDEMFSDFEEHVLAVPQIAPSVGNVTFDGPGANEDFGLEQVTGNAADRYEFRSSPLRNVGLQPTFMHNGAFVRLEDAIRHHLNARESLRAYSTRGLDADLRGPLGPSEPLLERLDRRLRTPLDLSDREFAALVDFVRFGLTDPAAHPDRLGRLVPERLPSGEPVHHFQFAP